MKNSDGRKLSREAQRWRGKILKAFEIDDAAGLLLLQTALESFDEMRAAQALVEKDGMTILDRFGQPKLNPATLVLRDCRTAMLRALRNLNLDVEVPASKVGKR